MKALHSASHGFHTRPTVALALTIGLTFMPHGHGQEASEYQVKAAFLHNFARYVEWPAASLPTAGAPLVIGIVGNDPFGKALDDVLRGTAANGHAIQLRRLRWNESLNGCHIAFISAAESDHLPAILQSVAGSSVLTVSDIDRFSLSGGMIELRMVGNRVRFDVNWTAADQVHLKISSQLLKVARVVRTDHAGEGSP